LLGFREREGSEESSREELSTKEEDQTVADAIYGAANQPEPEQGGGRGKEVSGRPSTEQGGGQGVEKDKKEGPEHNRSLGQRGEKSQFLEKAWSQKLNRFKDPCRPAKQEYLPTPQEAYHTTSKEKRI
jgi:hypothetical protein